MVGIDEVGRGPLAGPVAVCAARVTPVALRTFSAIKESKQLTPRARLAWFRLLTAPHSGVTYCVSMESASAIDTRGIAPSISRALPRAIHRVAHQEWQIRVLLDGGLVAPTTYTNQVTIIHGDAQETAIAIASVLAKVTRDRLMVSMSARYPDYGFERHMGYGTPAHISAILAQGMTPIHRKSFCTRFVDTSRLVK